MAHQRPSSRPCAACSSFFADLRDIDLRDRFTTGRFLDQHELDDLVALSHLPLQSGQTRTTARTVALGTVSIRLHYERAYP